jgi:hypothetical protein
MILVGPALGSGGTLSLPYRVQVAACSHVERADSHFIAEIAPV